MACGVRSSDCGEGMGYTVKSTCDGVHVHDFAVDLDRRVSALAGRYIDSEATKRHNVPQALPAAGLVA
jgi:hypothetical protein